MHGVDFHWIRPRVAYDPEHTIIAFRNCSQPMFHAWIIFICLCSLRLNGACSSHAISIRRSRIRIKACWLNSYFITSRPRSGSRRGREADGRARGIFPGSTFRAFLARRSRKSRGNTGRSQKTKIRGQGTEEAKKALKLVATGAPSPKNESGCIPRECRSRTMR